MGKVIGNSECKTRNARCKIENANHATGRVCSMRARCYLHFESCMLHSPLSISWRRVENLRARSGAVAERRKVNVEAGAGADGAQEGAVDPGHERAIELARPLESLAVLADRRDED